MDLATPRLIDPNDPDPEIWMQTPISPMFSVDDDHQNEGLTRCDVVEEPKDEKKTEPLNIPLPPTSDGEIVFLSASTRKFDLPAEIPLPISPPASPIVSLSQGRNGKSTTLPARRPAGWISSIPSSRTVSFSRQPSISTSKKDEVVKDEIQRKGSDTTPKERKVSGALQYALLGREPENITEAEDDIGNANLGDSPPPGFILSNDDYVSAEDGESIELTTEITSAQENDEIWMSYVRQQLSSLFPDLDSGYPSLSLFESGSGQIVGSDDATRGVLSDKDPSPSLRNEMAGLKEEIGRLRGVVGELAIGMRAQSGSRLDYATLSVVEGEEDLEEEGEGRMEEQQKVDFLSNINLSLSIMRMIDALTRPLAPSSSTPDQDGQNTELLPSNVFSLDNLTRIRNVLSGWERERDRLEKTEDHADSVSLST